MKVVKWGRGVKRGQGRRGATEIQERLDSLAQSLLERDVKLTVKLDTRMHDREVRFDNGWRVKIGRGLDFYQPPENWFVIGSQDMELRPCLETMADIFKAQE